MRPVRPETGPEAQGEEELIKEEGMMANSEAGQI